MEALESPGAVDARRASLLTSLTTPTVRLEHTRVGAPTLDASAEMGNDAPLQWEEHCGCAGMQRPERAWVCTRQVLECG